MWRSTSRSAPTGSSLRSWTTAAALTWRRCSSAPPVAGASASPAYTSGCGCWAAYAGWRVARAAPRRSRSCCPGGSRSSRRRRPAWRRRDAPRLHRPRLCGRNEAVLVGVADRAAAVGDAELAVDVREMELDGVLAQPELAADRLRRLPVCDSREDFALALRQSGALGCGLSADRLRWP